MRKLTLVAAIIAAGLLPATLARADFNGGGPVMKGKMCWAATSALDHGMWVACPKPAKPMKMSKKKK